MKLGILKKVDLREVWRREAEDFTPWLANEDNLKLLGDTIAIDLELESREKNVGPFRADILCKDAGKEDSWVLIENQLARTDHTHLGQLLTYAAGLNAVTIVWVAERFTEEHRAALDWLNEITEDNFNFFGIEVELWKIGDSETAPKFNIVSKPNDWVKNVSGVKRAISQEGITETRKLQLEYWIELREQIINSGSILKPQKALPQHWFTLSLGKSGFHVVATCNSREERIGVEVTISNDAAKIYFRLLEQQKQEIEKELGMHLLWYELPNKKSCRIVIYKNNTDPNDKSLWSEQHKWLQETIEKFYKVFSPRVRKLELDLE